MDSKQLEGKNVDSATGDAKNYRIRIDKDVREVPQSALRGSEILALVGKTPQTHRLFQKIERQPPLPIAPEQLVDLTPPGTEHFVTIPLDVTEGEQPRRQFAPSEVDATFLESSGFRWEAIREGDQNWVILHDFPLPSGYDYPAVQLGIWLLPGYPVSALDMAYLCPAVGRVDGRPIRGLSQRALDGKSWQQWSRHRSGTNPWRPGIDGLESQVLLARGWLELELTK